MIPKNPRQPNVNHMLKAEIVDRHNYRCQHGHDGFAHPACYARDRGIGEKIGCLDIETSNLHADFGLIMSWCIKLVGKDEIWYDNITLDDIRKDRYDKRLVASLCNNLTQLDRVVTQFGTYFDIPFIRTRAVTHGIEHPRYGELYHTDVWKIAKRKLCLHSNRQGSIAQTVLHEDIKTRIHPDVWLKIQFGSNKNRKEAIAYVLDHNEKDVIQLEQNYLALRPFIREGRTSI